MSNGNETTVKRSALLRFLDGVEKIGNKFPHPATLFAIFAVTVAVLSWIIARAGRRSRPPQQQQLLSLEFFPEGIDLVGVDDQRANPPLEVPLGLRRQVEQIAPVDIADQHQVDDPGIPTLRVIACQIGGLANSVV